MKHIYLIMMLVIAAVVLVQFSPVIGRYINEKLSDCRGSLEQIISQKLKFVPLLISADVNAGIDSDSVNMAGMKSATFICMFGADYAGSTAGVIKLYSGVTHAAKTTAMTFNYKYGGAATKSPSADILTALASSAALGVANATLAGRLLLIEINVDQITDGHQFLTIEIGSQADAGTLTIVALLDPMYKDASLDTNLPLT